MSALENGQDVADANAAGQIRIRLSTREANLAVPDVPLLVPLSLRRYGLSEIVNHLLNTDTPIPFDFLINNELLRTSLEDYIVSKGLSAEVIIDLEYTRSILPPSFLASFAHPDWVSSVSIIQDDASASTPKAAPILSGCYDGVLRTWTLSGSVAAEYAGHTGPIKSVKWLESASERRLVSASMDRSIRIWKSKSAASDFDYDDNEDEDQVDADATIVKASRVFTGHTASVDNIDVHAGSHRILSASSDGKVGLWTTIYKQSPDATLPVASQVGGTKRRRKSSTSVTSKGPLSMMSSHNGPVTDVLFDRKDSTVGYSVSLDHTIKTWDLVTSSLVDSRTTGFALLCIAHLPQLSLLCCGSSARHVTLHDPRVSADKTTSLTLYGHNNFVVDIANSPESPYMFATASYDSTVRIWDVRAERSLYVISRGTASSVPDSTKKVFGVDWTKSVGIVSAGEDKRVQVNRGTGLQGDVPPTNK
ncbi:WD40-repeat-containing domain protein [Lipomyces oligophaga]|uniref:WD40-repeat-containing domain protein n=1 Tax=Lipomyces oligophaga TaxID=45792 RepID=UPI0034CE42CE